PERPTEGAPVVEEIALTNPRIPTGFRLFATGCVGPRWPITRYVVDEVASGGELRLESEIGPALRGEHEAAPLSIWLEDVFGLCRSIRVYAGATRLTVLPEVAAVNDTT